MKKNIFISALLFSLVAANSYAYHRATEYKCEGTDLKITFRQTWAEDGTPTSATTKLGMKKTGTGALGFDTNTPTLTSTPMGLVVSTVQGTVADSHSTVYSVVIPLVNLADLAHVVHFSSVLTTTISKTSVGGPALVSGLVEENTFAKLRCVARMIPAPRPAPAPSPTPAPVPAPVPASIN